MANCEFAGGIKNVRGTVSKKTYFIDGKKVTNRVVAMVHNGKQHFYIRTDRQRSTPITEKEIAARAKFREATVYGNNLSDEQMQTFHDEWKRSKYMFNGKKYGTLRGYVIARFFARAIQS